MSWGDQRKREKLACANVMQRDFRNIDKCQDKHTYIGNGS